MKHKKLFITLTVIFSILLALSIFIMIWFWGDRYDDFKDFRSEVAISGLKDGACPQGITVYKADTVKEKDDDGKETEVIKKQNYFFITAYFKDKASRIYVVGDQTGETGYVTLKNVDGTDHTGHVGGIATNGRFVWVCSGNTIYVAKNGTRTDDNVAIDLIKAAKENGSIQFTTSFNANCNAAFLYYYDDDDKAPSAPSSSDRLYVGEFYRAGNYETNEKHTLTTPNGETNRAWAYEYNVETTNSSVHGLSPVTNIKDENGNAVPKIQKVFSLPDKIQGFARTANGIVLSESYGLDNSHIYYYSFNWGKTDAKDLEKNSRVKYTAIGTKDDPGTYRDTEADKDAEKNTNTGTDKDTVTDKDVEKANEKKNKLYLGGLEYAGATTANKAPYYDKSSSLYLYYIDGSTMLNDYSIPSMSEGLCTTDGKVYVLFESGAKKYNKFVRQVLTNVYSFYPQKKH